MSSVSPACRKSRLNGAVSRNNRRCLDGHVKEPFKQKQKYQGMFETQKSGEKASSGEIGLNIRTLASPKVGQDQASGGKRPLLACRTHCKCSMETSRN